jgi:NADP-dependent 3-hydroxy acid dehydrogenase YdfG
MIFMIRSVYQPDAPPAKAVAPHMIKQGSGVIMMISATPARLGFPLVGGFGVACAATVVHNSPSRQPYRSS